MLHFLWTCFCDTCELKVNFYSLWETASQSHWESFSHLTLEYALNTRCFSFIPALLGLPPSLAALWISEVIPRCYNATSPQTCLNDDNTYALPWEEFPTTKSPHALLGPHLMTLSCWLKVCQHLRHWSIKRNKCWPLAALLTCGSLFSCVSVSAVCLVFGYVCTAFCSMSWRKITQPGSLEDPTCRRKSIVLCHCSSFSSASSFRFTSLYCTWNSRAQTLFCIGNAFDIRSRGIVPLLIDKYVFTWIGQAMYFYKLQMCTIMTGETIESRITGWKRSQGSSGLTFLGKSMV